jgi:hypothetical protein
MHLVAGAHALVLRLAGASALAGGHADALKRAIVPVAVVAAARYIAVYRLFAGGRVGFALLWHSQTSFIILFLV